MVLVLLMWSICGGFCVAGCSGEEKDFMRSAVKVFKIRILFK